jgi:hypothetical protein
MSLLQNSNAISAGGYDINNSLRFKRSSSAYLSRTMSASGTTCTWSVWVKRGQLGVIQGIFDFTDGVTTSFGIEFTASDTIDFYNFLNLYTMRLNTTQVFRDPSAWYHIVAVIDTTNATSSDRARLYVNGQRVTAFSTATYPTQNLAMNISTSRAFDIGATGATHTQNFDGYLAEFNFIDGQALTPSSFGETDPVTGSWVAKKYTGTYGTNGFYLPFSDTDSNENLVLSSEDFSNATYWNKATFPCTVTANSVVSPNGTTTADTILGANGATSLVFQIISSPNNGSALTASIYAKAGTGSQFTLNAYYANDAEINTTFDLSTGTIVPGLGTALGVITSVGNGWYRCSVNIPARTGAGVEINFRIWPNPRGDATNRSIHVWGAQLNYGSIAKKYIATTTAAVTNQGTIENLLTYSEDLTNAAWAKANVTATGNTIAAPNGSTTADTLFEAAVTGEHYLERPLTPTTNTQYVFSTYVKYLNRKYIALRIVYSNGAQDTIAIFDIQNGTYYGYGVSAPTATSITSVGNGWYRISATFTTPATNPTSSLLFRHEFFDDSLNASYAGNASVGMYLWGSQIETQGTLGPYLPTVASTQGLVHRIGTDRSLGATGFGYNTWTPNNISLTLGTTYDAMIDSPTLTSATVANYAVLNPLKMPAPASVSYTNGNLSVSCGNGNQTPALATIYPSSGKWYWEVIWTSGSFARVGVQNTNVASTDFAADTAGWRWESNTGNIYNGSTLATVSTYATNDILGFCLDCDAGKLYVSKNGTWQNSAVPASGTGAVATNIPTSTLMSPAVATGSGTSVFVFNAGQRPFSYTPPTGFVALNTYNLPDSTIKKGNTVMDAVLWTGAGQTGAASITGLNFKPDFVWAKMRSSAISHTLYNSIVGGGANKALSSNGTDTEASFNANATNGYLSSFDSNGFSYFGGSSPAYFSSNGNTYVGWAWQAGQGTTSSNTSGTITSTVSVSTTAGFSVVTYTGNGTSGATIGHGLGVAPSMLIVRDRNTVNDWVVYHKSIGNTGCLVLNSTSATVTSSGFWNNTTPTSTVYSAGTASNVNSSSRAYVAYCWAEIAGFSKFGSYTGNGSTDGPFVYLGFRPKFVMIKRTNTTEDWMIWDTSRSPYNAGILRLYPNTSGAENSTDLFDILSNGFKCRDNDPVNNASGSTYIYAAFAEVPTKFSNAR